MTHVRADSRHPEWVNGALVVIGAMTDAERQRVIKSRETATAVETAKDLKLRLPSMLAL